MILPNRSLPYAKTMQTRGKRACSYFPECSLPYTKIRKMVCNVNTITLFFRNQECIKKHKTIVLSVKFQILQTENYAVEIRKTESESKNGSIRHIAQYPVTQRIIQNNLPTTLFPVHDKGFSAKPKRLFRHAGKTLRHPGTHFPPPQKARLTGTRHAEHNLTERNTLSKPPKTRRREAEIKKTEC